MIRRAGFKSSRNSIQYVGLQTPGFLPIAYRRVFADRIQIGLRLVLVNVPRERSRHAACRESLARESPARRALQGDRRLAAFRQYRGAGRFNRIVLGWLEQHKRAS